MVLFVPGVEAVEVEDHVVVQVGVGGPERHSVAGLAGGVESERLAVGGVDGERHRRVQDGLAVG